MNYFYSDVAVCGVLVFLRTVLNCFICELFGLMTARLIKYLLTYTISHRQLQQHWCKVMVIGVRVRLSRVRI